MIQKVWVFIVLKREINKFPGYIICPLMTKSHHSLQNVATITGNQRYMPMSDERGGKSGTFVLTIRECDRPLTEKGV